LTTKGIFFDFDGVMADTMPYHLVAWNYVLERGYGFSLDPMSVKLNEGRPVYEIAEAVFKDAQKSYTPEILTDVITRKNEHFRATHKSVIFPENLKIIKRAKDLGLQVGLVTGTKRENIGIILSDDLLVQFDIIIADGDSMDGSTDINILKNFNVNTLLIKKGVGRLGAQMRMAFAWALKRGYEGVIVIDGNNKDSVESLPNFETKIDNSGAGMSISYKRSDK